MKTCEICGQPFAKRKKEAYWQFEARRSCSRPCASKAQGIAQRVPNGQFKARYRQVTTPDGRKILEHRYVMEQVLGRRLKRSEQVHHRNRNRGWHPVSRGRGGGVRFPPDRHLDNRWNAALDALTKAWNELGPDAALASLQALTGLHAATGDVAPGEGRAGICVGCGRSRYLHANGTVIAHRPGGSRSPAECGGSNRLPAGPEEIAARAAG